MSNRNSFRVLFDNIASVGYILLEPALCQLYRHTFVPYGCGSVLLYRRCDMLCTSGFMYYVMFAHDCQEEATE